MTAEERMCTHCVMNTSDPSIFFDADGVCNHCREYEQIKSRVLFRNEEEGEAALVELVKRIKDAGKGKEYDCITGVSGGIDSSYVTYLAHQKGLRVLAVHLDNGWDQEIAVSNIECLLRATDFDLYTHVIDWQEFRDLQLAFMKASVIDIEMTTDHAITACLHRVGLSNNIRCILSGNNEATEGVMPRGWKHRKSDLRQIRAINRKYGRYEMHTYPTASTLQLLFNEYVRGVKTVNMLNYILYDKQEAKAILEREIGWRDYGEKHYESIITKFYQGYILPQKFGVDKRRAHYSSLICSGQMSRETALALLAKDAYPPEEFLREREYFLRKMELSEAEFEAIMRQPARRHAEYPSDEWVVRPLALVRRWTLWASEEMTRRAARVRSRMREL